MTLATIAGCGSGVPKAGRTGAVALRLQRADLVVVSQGLRQISHSVGLEVEASRRAWPAIAQGLPRRISPAVRAQILMARTEAKLVVTPRFLAQADELTGPAAGIAALLRSFSGLIERGWRLTEATITGVTTGSPATARFLRANAGLYINCVYDGHYNLAAIGETLRKAYVKLGGAQAFGASLTQAEVDGIASAYAPAMARLQPRPAPWLGH